MQRAYGLAVALIWKDMLRQWYARRRVKMESLINILDGLEAEGLVCEHELLGQSDLLLSQEDLLCHGHMRKNGVS